MERFSAHPVFQGGLVMVLVMLLCPSKVSPKEVSPMEPQYIVIWYIHPEIQTYVPIAKEDIEERCLAKIVIGNKRLIGQVSDILTMVKNAGIASRGIVDSVTFKIRIRFRDRDEIWFVDKRRNFELEEGAKGQIPAAHFRKLVQTFDAYSGVADLKYVEEVKENRGRF